MSEPLPERPLVGLGVLILKEGKILLGKRKGSFGAGEHCFPGGYLEYMESFEDCARREVREETGIEIANLKFMVLTTIRDYAPKHFVQIGLVADWASGEAKVMEPEKCEGWGWYDPNNLPVPMFRPSMIALTAYKKGEPLIDLKA